MGVAHSIHETHLYSIDIYWIARGQIMCTTENRTGEYIDVVSNQLELSASRTKVKTTTGTAVFRGGLPVFCHSLHTPRVAKYLCLMFPNQEGAGGTGGEGGHVTYPGALVTELKSES